MKLSREMKLNVSYPGAGSVPLVGSPIKIPTAPVEFRLSPPLLGEHTVEILKELLGHNQEGVKGLRNNDVICRSESLAQL